MGAKVGESKKIGSRKRNRNGLLCNGLKRLCSIWEFTAVRAAESQRKLSFSYRSTPVQAGHLKNCTFCTAFSFMRMASFLTRIHAPVNQALVESHQICEKAALSMRPLWSGGEGDRLSLCSWSALYVAPLIEAIKGFSIFTRVNMRKSSRAVRAFSLNMLKR